MDHVASSALRAGFPLIYVSSTKAMKDVLRGILRRVPDFKRFNQEGKVRLYDLFTKEADQKVMRDGHRLFRIDDASDFKKFTEDLLFVQEELTKEFGGGVLIINSLSPLILKAEAGAHQKFIQTLIARSKGYRFTNIFDIAAGIHDEPLINSLEYMMDGIIDFREQDARYSLRVRGLSQGVITRDWIEYNFNECGMDLFGSFTEERIA
jgi:KaiC/GvpD/RAD55 family RecA-like ATPase